MRGWEDFKPHEKIGRTVKVHIPAMTDFSQPKSSKYHAQPCEVDGVRFDSKKEAKRYEELKQLGMAGELWDLELQPRFPLHVLSAELGVYRGDFAYQTAAGRVVEDVKGYLKTPIYRWKAKHVLAEYGITIVEV